MDEIWKGLLTEFGKWGPAGLIVLTIAVFAFLYGKYFLLPKQQKEDARLDSQTKTFDKLSETVVTLSVVAGQIHSSVTTTLASAEQQRAQMTMLIRVARLCVGMAKKLAINAGIDLDEEIGECKGVLDDGSAIMKSLTPRDEELDRIERRRKSGGL